MDGSMSDHIANLTTARLLAEAITPSYLVDIHSGIPGTAYTTLRTYVPCPE
jgi:hypothetical protein